MRLAIDNPTFASTRTLKARPWQFRWLWGLLLFTLLIGAGLEALARTYSHHLDLPPTSFGAPYRRFEVMIARMDAYQDKYGQIDCVFIGSSLVEKGIQPRLFADTIRQRTGQDITCFNMGLGSISMSSIGEVVPILIQRYDPALIIVGTQARAFNEIGLLRSDDPTHAAEHQLANNFWVRYQRGDWNAQGWLWENLHLYRFYLTIGAAFGADYDGTTLRDELILTEDGYQDLIGSIVDVTQPIDRTRPNNIDDGIVRFFEGYTVAENDLAGLIRLTELARPQIIVLEMPIHPSYVDYLPQGQAQYDAFIATLESTLAGSDVLFWRTTPFFNRTIPDAYWFDRYHLNRQGSPILTRWLANQVADALVNGQLAPIQKEP